MDDSIDNIEENDMIKIPLDINEEKYLLKIYPSEDEINIIFKLEVDKIQTYYYSEEFDLRDFRQKNKSFISDDNIQELFTHLKEIKQKCIITLEKKLTKINITFKSNIDSKFILVFTVRKKVLSQNKLNPLLVEQIQANKAKIKILKKQIVKLNKAIQTKTDVINNLNNSISNINNAIDNINMNNTNNSNSNTAKDDESNNNNNGNNNNNNDKEDEDISKDNSSNQDQEQEEKRYISNNRKRKNKKQNKKIKFFHIDNNNNNNNKNNQDNSIFCFENVEILGNKKIFELLVIFNIITILIILCLLGSIYSIKSDLEYEKVIEEEFMNKLAYLNIVNDYGDEELNKKNKGGEGKNGMTEKGEIDEIRNSLFENEDQELYFKEEIIKKEGGDIKDVYFMLKYSSISEQKSFEKFYDSCKGVLENLILLKNSRGKKFGLFSKNIHDILHGIKPQDALEFQNNFVMYSFNAHDIFEYTFKNFMDIYGAFVQSVFNFFSNEKIPFENKYYNMSIKNRQRSSQLLGNIVEIEIYQVKFIK